MNKFIIKKKWILFPFLLALLGVFMVTSGFGQDLTKKVETTTQIFDSIKDTEQYLVIEKENGTTAYVSVDGTEVTETELQGRNFNTATVIDRGSQTTSSRYRDDRIEKFHGTPASWTQFSTPYPDDKRIAYLQSSDTKGGAVWQFNFETGEIVKLFDFNDFPEPEVPYYENLGSNILIKGILNDDKLLIGRGFRSPNDNSDFGITEYWVLDPTSGEYRKTSISGKLTGKTIVSANGKYLIYGINTIGHYNLEEGKSTDEYHIFDLETWWNTGMGESKLLVPYPGEIKGWITTEENEVKIPSVKKKDLGFSFMEMVTCPDSTCYEDDAGMFYLPVPCGVSMYQTRGGDDCTISSCNLDDNQSPSINGFHSVNYDPHTYRGFDFSDLTLATLMHGEGLNYLCAKDGVVYLAGWGTGGAGWRVVVRHNVGNPDLPTDDVFSQYYHMVSGTIPFWIVPDEVVTVGDVLGQIGNSGVSDIHVHFDTRRADASDPDGPPLTGALGSFYPRFHETGPDVVPTESRIYVSENGGSNCDVLDCSSVSIISAGQTLANQQIQSGLGNIRTYYSKPFDFNGNSNGKAPPNWNCDGKEKVYSLNAQPGAFYVTLFNQSQDLDVFVMNGACGENLDPLYDCVGISCGNSNNHPSCFPSIQNETHVVYVSESENPNGGVYTIVVDGSGTQAKSFNIEVSGDLSSCPDNSGNNFDEATEVSFPGSFTNTMTLTIDECTSPSDVDIFKIDDIDEGGSLQATLLNGHSPMRVSIYNRFFQKLVDTEVQGSGGIPAQAEICTSAPLGGVCWQCEIVYVKISHDYGPIPPGSGMQYQLLLEWTPNENCSTTLPEDFSGNGNQSEAMRFVSVDPLAVSVSCLGEGNSADVLLSASGGSGNYLWETDDGTFTGNYIVTDISNTTVTCTAIPEEGDLCNAPEVVNVSIFYGMCGVANTLPDIEVNVVSISNYDIETDQDVDITFTVCNNSAVACDGVIGSVLWSNNDGAGVSDIVANGSFFSTQPFDPYECYTITKYNLEPPQGSEWLGNKYLIPHANKLLQVVPEASYSNNHDAISIEIGIDDDCNAPAWVEVTYCDADDLNIKFPENQDGDFLIIVVVASNPNTNEIVTIRNNVITVQDYYHVDDLDQFGLDNSWFVFASVRYVCSGSGESDTKITWVEYDQCTGCIVPEDLQLDEAFMYGLELEIDDYGAEEYEMRVRPQDGSGSWTEKTFTDDDVYFGSLARDKWYEVQVRAFCADEWTDWSSSIYEKTLGKCDNSVEFMEVTPSVDVVEESIHLTAVIKNVTSEGRESSYTTATIELLTSVGDSLLAPIQNVSVPSLDPGEDYLIDMSLDVPEGCNSQNVKVRVTVANNSTSELSYSNNKENFIVSIADNSCADDLIAPWVVCPEDATVNFAADTIIYPLGSGVFADDDCMLDSISQNVQVNLDSLDAGTVVHTYTVYDASGNSAQAVRTITVLGYIPCTVEIQISGDTLIECYGGNDADATVLVTGGYSPFIYAWKRPTGSTSTTPYIGNLGNPGWYVVTVTDDIGCTVVDSINIVESSELSVSFVSSDISCYDAEDGSITTTVFGGSPSYDYYWVRPNGYTSTTPVINNLKVPGWYKLTVTDSHGCSLVDSVMINEPDLLEVFMSSQNISSPGGNDGWATAYHNGGTSPFTYFWTRPTGSNSTTQHIGNLSNPGWYAVTITDANACTTVDSVEIIEPVDPLSVIVTGGDITTNGGNDGWATATPSGGIPPYSYDWLRPTGYHSTTATISNLSNDGWYIVTVFDKDSIVTVVDSIYIAEPPNMFGSGNSDGTTDVLTQAEKGSAIVIVSNPFSQTLEFIVHGQGDAVIRVVDIQTGILVFEHQCVLLDWKEFSLTRNFRDGGVYVVTLRTKNNVVAEKVISMPFKN